MFHHLLFESTLVSKRVKDSKATSRAAGVLGGEVKHQLVELPSVSSGDMGNFNSIEALAPGESGDSCAEPNSKRPRRACRDSAQSTGAYVDRNSSHANGEQDDVDDVEDRTDEYQHLQKGNASLRRRNSTGNVRPSRNHRRSGANANGDVKQGSDGGPSSSGSGKNRRKTTFNSLEEGARQGRLFHSIEQTRLNVEQFQEIDSDNEEELEQEWRFRLRHDEISDFTDTVPTEMLFMHLWNQFVGMEFKIYADKCVAEACLAFVNKYFNTMRRLKIHASFVRFMREMVETGLLDANDVFKCLSTYKELTEENSPDKEENSVANEPTFLYEEMLLSKACKDSRRKKRIGLPSE